jgi:hypothetical protein
MGRLKVRNTTVNGGMSGLDNGTNKVFRYREGKNYSSAGNRVIPRNPNSDAQRVVRSGFSQMSALWSSLTDVERDSWDKGTHVRAWQNSDGFGGLTSLTGKALFVGVNTRLIANGFSSISTCDGAPQIVTGGVIFAINAFSPSSKMLEITCPVGSSEESFIVSASAPFSAGSNVANKKTTILLSGADFENEYGPTDNFTTMQNINIRSLFASKYGDGIQGQKVRIELLVINKDNGLSRKIGDIATTIS